MSHQVVKVEGMHCPKCEVLLSVSLEDLGAQNVVADRETGVVEFDGDLTPEAVREAVEDCGFTVVA